ncbi:MAG: class I SAM-dependent methyltransferase [Archangium sp.]|nr:class I SAM-dependent methyltransferase [Archangium sp.]
MKLLSLLVEPRLRGVDITGPQRLPLHQKILAEKKMIRAVFEEFYRTSLALEAKHFGSTTGLRVEIGAGTSFFKSLQPDLISTDLEASPHLDMVVDAQRMPFENESVRTLFCINAFHHFPEPRKFFSEVMRVVRPGGGCIIIDPAYGPVSDFLYRRLFSSEGYDRASTNWGYLPGADGQSLPNQALSFVVFIRDIEKLTREFPALELVEKDVLPSYLEYLLSGGLNFRQLVADWMQPGVRALETALHPFRRQLGLHHFVVLRKSASAPAS